MQTKRLYECLLLVDPAVAASNWDEIVGKITAQIEKRGGEIKSLKKWDERQLAYEIDGKARGTYILFYFECETKMMAAIERDFNLSEDIMRSMILRADFIKSEEQMDKKAPEFSDFMYRNAGASENPWKSYPDKAVAAPEPSAEEQAGEQEVSDETAAAPEQSTQDGESETEKSE